MRDYVRDRLSIAASDSTKQTQIDTLLNIEYRRLCAEERLNIERTTLTAVAGSQLVDLPNDWVETLTFTWGTSTVQPVTFDEFARLDAQEGDAGGIVYYQESPERVRVYPTPNATNLSQMTLWYVARPDAMASDNDSPSALPFEYHDLLAESVVYRIAMSEEMFESAQYARATADELRSRMAGHMRRRQGSGASRVVLKVYDQ